MAYRAPNDFTCEYYIGKLAKIKTIKVYEVEVIETV